MAATLFASHICSELVVYLIVTQFPQEYLLSTYFELKLILQMLGNWLFFKWGFKIVVYFIWLMMLSSDEICNLSYFMPIVESWSLSFIVTQAPMMVNNFLGKYFFPFYITLCLGFRIYGFVFTCYKNWYLI